MKTIADELWAAGNMSSFGAWLERARDKRGVSQRWLSRASGVSQAQISKLESGEEPGTRAIIDKLVRTLAGEDMEPEEVETLVNDALISAGFIPDGQAVRAFDPDDPRSNPKLKILDAADDLSLEMLEMMAAQMETTAREFRKLNPRTGTFGKRARDDEE